MAIITAKHIHKEYDVGPAYWNPSGTQIFDYHYLWLTDTGFVYGVVQTGDGWIAQMFKVSDRVTERRNIWRMTATGTKADATSVGPEGRSDPYKTKAALKEAIELVHADWEATIGMSEEETLAYVERQKQSEPKVQPPRPVSAPSPSEAAPKWVWYLAAAVVVAVAIALLSN